MKLEAAGIRGSIYKFIRDFLSDRSCRFNVNGELSTKSAVKSGIPQGSILGPLLFIIFINDLPSDIKNHCMMFADDTKIFGNPGKALQLDIERADDWAHTWQINFNVAKCKVLHFGRKDNTYDYYMSNQNHMCKIVSTSPEKDIGVIFDDNLLFDSHIATTVNKCQGILSIIKRSFLFIDEHTLPLLYVTLVRPILEYSSVIWALHLRKHIIKLEAVQRRATRMIPNLKDIAYIDRLRKLNLFSLAYRRRRGDLIQVYKLLHNIDNVNYSQLFDINHSITRGHDFKLKKRFSKTNSRKFTFSQRMVNDWNSLPPAVVSADDIKCFKTGVDNFLWNYIYDF